MLRRINWPVVLATLFVVLLVGHLLNTQRIYLAMRADAERLARIYNEVQNAIADTTSGATDDALYALQQRVIESGIPMVVTGVGDSVLYAINTPFTVDLETAEGQADRKSVV